MKEQIVHLSYKEYASSGELNASDAELLQQAKKAASQAYAPYSHFRVGAAARLKNGVLVTGSNQENASYPVGICAERALLASAGVQFPGVPIVAMAISYESDSRPSALPVAPCGMCRQALQEFEERTGHPVRLLLSGSEGPVIEIDQSGLLLPLAFSRKELKP